MSGPNEYTNEWTTNPKIPPIEDIAQNAIRLTLASKKDLFALIARIRKVQAKFVIMENTQAFRNLKELEHILVKLYDGNFSATLNDNPIAQHCERLRKLAKLNMEQSTTQTDKDYFLGRMDAYKHIRDFVGWDTSGQNDPFPAKRSLRSAYPESVNVAWEENEK